MTAMRKLHTALLATALSWVASAFMVHAAPVRVVATLPNLGSIAGEIGGERIDLTVIAAGTQDAHFVDPKPSFMIRLRRADLLFINGLDLEIGWVPPLTEGARNSKIIRGGPGYVDCSRGIRAIEVPTSLTRAEGDVHPYGNPHYLTDPLNAEIVARTIADALASADPAHAAEYERGRKAFTHRLHESIFGKELVDLVGGAKLSREAAAGTLEGFLEGTSLEGKPLADRLGGWLGALAPFKGRAVVTYHKDYSYFSNRFGIRVVDYVEPKPGISPSPRHLEELTELLAGGGIPIIISRPYLEHRSTEVLEERTGVRTITLPLEAGGAEGVDDYLALYDHVVNEIAAALRDGSPAEAR